MIAISKEEKNIIHAAFPQVHIVRTMKQKSKRHRYYCEETRQVMYLLEELRGGKPADKGHGRGAFGADRTRRRREQV